MKKPNRSDRGLLVTIATLSTALLAHQFYSKHIKFISIDKPSPSAVSPPSAAEGRRAPATTGAQSPSNLAAAGQGSKSRVDKQSSGLREELHRLKSCYASMNCQLAIPGSSEALEIENDPKAYDYKLGRAIEAQLKELDKNSSAVDEEIRGEIAREFLQVTDGYVQSAALDVLSGLPVSEQNLQAIISGVGSTTDPTLMAQAMVEFRRYLGQSSEPLIHRYLGEQMGFGPHFTSEAISKGILVFINEKSFSQYQSSYRSMNPQSSAAQALRAALDQYNKLANRG